MGLLWIRHSQTFRNLRLENRGVQNRNIYSTKYPLLHLSTLSLSLSLSLSLPLSLSHTHTLFLSLTHILSRSLTNALSFFRSLSFSLSHTHGYTHARTNTRTHTHTHTHMHTMMSAIKRKACSCYLDKIAFFLSLTRLIFLFLVFWCGIQTLVRTTRERDQNTYSIATGRTQIKK